MWNAILKGVYARKIQPPMCCARAPFDDENDLKILYITV